MQVTIGESCSINDIHCAIAQQLDEGTFPLVESENISAHTHKMERYITLLSQECVKRNREGHIEILVDGCLADIIYRPSSILQDRFLRIQVKSTRRESITPHVWLFENRKNYEGML